MIPQNMMTNSDLSWRCLCRYYVDVFHCEDVVRPHYSLSWLVAHSLVCVPRLRINISGPWGSSCTSPAPHPTRPFLLNCASKHCPTRRPPRAGASRTPAATQGGSLPSPRAGRPCTPSPGSWSPAGTPRPWAALRGTPTQTHWPPREARTAMALAGPLAHGCQTSTTWKRQLFKRQSHYHTVTTVTPAVLYDHDCTI